MSEIKKVPKLRFKKFTEDWKEKKVKQLSEVSSGGTPSRSNPNYWNGTIPWISTSLIDFKDITCADEYITEEGLKNSSAKLFPKGTILMAMYGQGKTRGKVALLKIEASTNQACAAFITNKLIYNGFLFQSFSNNYDNIRNLSNEGGQKNLSGGLLKNYKISFPSLAEQKKIASFLSSVDKKLTLLQQKKSLLEDYKKGVMQQLFSQQLRFKDSNGNEFPKWEEKRLGSIGETISGLTGKSKENFGIGKPYIQYKQIFDSSKIKIQNCGFVDVAENENQTKVKFGDVFFTTSSETPHEIGTASVLLDEVEEMYLNSFCFGLRIDKSVLYPSFAQFLFRSPQFRKKMMPLAQGSTRYNISKSSFMKLKIKLPSIEEQTKIANFLSAIDDKIQLVAESIEATQQFKKGLLQQMFV